ncbi:N-acetylmuramoyl-L-alanine amidase [bacterium]|nr:N-acetylmuramoyl-L-alanine amidase [bacterium]
MRRLVYLKAVILFLVLCCYSSVAWALNSVSNIRTGQQNDGIRIVFDGTEKFQYDAFLLGNPNRLVIDLKNTAIKGNPKVPANAIIRDFRIGELSGGKGKRLVFELKGNADIKRKFALEPQAGKSNWRLVIDLVRHPDTAAPKAASAAKAVATYKPNPKRQKIVVLDPGHGGTDPGAIGRSFRTYEKNITLSMGKELKKQLESRGFKVFMTRSTDIFIPLRQRVRIARNYHADLFISLHADSTVNRNAQGLSIYTLSETASDKEAAALAERENKADIIDGMDFSDNSPEINDVLISLSQNDSRNKSSKFAAYVVNEMKKQVKIQNNTHRFAGFAVLKAPDIPSVLVELGYVSNYTEEKYLRDPSYRKKLGAAITRSVVSYFADPEIASSL